MQMENAGDNYQKRYEGWLHQLSAVDFIMKIYVSKMALLLYSILPILSPGGSDDHHVMRGQRDLQIITTAISALQHRATTIALPGKWATKL